MPRLDSSTTTLSLAVAIAAAVGLAVTGLPDAADWNLGETASVSSAHAASPPARTIWAASAPGRVEPRNGEVRISAQTSGRIVEIPARLNEAVSAEDLLVRLDDTDAQARLLAAEAEVAVRKRERDAETVGKVANDRRVAEDAVAASERNVFRLRIELDGWVAARREGRVSVEDVARAREALAAARDKLEQDRATLRKAQAVAGIPLPTRLESGLTVARSDLSLAEAALDRTRVRAPTAGSVLQIIAKVGETATASPENVLVQFGDLSALRVRAELEERDVSKVRVGQKAVVRSDAFPDREFEGKVGAVAQSLGPPRLSNKGPRRPNDVDVLEVLVELDGLPPLLAGMRVDVFLRPDATVETKHGERAPAPAAPAADGTKTR
jgi:HlyD family secretion protein